VIPAFYNDWDDPNGKCLPVSWTDTSLLSLTIFQMHLLRLLAEASFVSPNTPVFSGSIAVFFPHLFVMLVLC
jgi:hypothetical protein